MNAVVFLLADKQYGASIEQILEVIRMRKVTPVPDAPDFVEGVISLRGKVIPLINLRKKLGIPEKASASNRILVTKIQDNLMALRVDQVQDVVTFRPEEIVPPDELLKSARYLLGVVKWKNGLVLIVDLAELLRSEERIGLQKIRERVEIKKK